MKGEIMNEQPMRILKTDSCPSLSGRSILTYHIGHKGKDVYFSLAENSKAGVLSREWLPQEKIKQLLAAEEYSFTSRSSSLHTLYKGHSINSGGFMLAVLLKEGLVGYAKGKKRNYCRCDSSTFDAAIQPLIEALMKASRKEEKQ
jgi:hypothetical protein